MSSQMEMSFWLGRRFSVMMRIEFQRCNTNSCGQKDLVPILPSQMKLLSCLTHRGCSLWLLVRDKELLSQGGLQFWGLGVTRSLLQSKKKVNWKETSTMEIGKLWKAFKVCNFFENTIWKISDPFAIPQTCQFPDTNLNGNHHEVKVSSSQKHSINCSKCNLNVYFTGHLTQVLSVKEEDRIPWRSLLHNSLPWQTQVQFRKGICLQKGQTTQQFRGRKSASKVPI